MTMLHKVRALHQTFNTVKGQDITLHFVRYGVNGEKVIITFSRKEEGCGPAQIQTCRQSAKSFEVCEMSAILGQTRVTWADWLKYVSMPDRWPEDGIQNVLFQIDRPKISEGLHYMLSVKKEEWAAFCEKVICEVG